jgi:hypothetical protein
VYYNVDIKTEGTRSRFTMFGEVCSYIYAMWNLPGSRSVSFTFKHILRFNTIYFDDKYLSINYINLAYL